MKPRRKRVGNPNWKRDPVEARRIERYADQWCKDNGYPIRKYERKT